MRLAIYEDIMSCDRSGLWPSWLVVVSVCGRFGLWPFLSVAVPVCGRFGLWPFRLSPFRFVAVMTCYRKQHACCYGTWQWRACQISVCFTAPTTLFTDVQALGVVHLRFASSPNNNAKIYNAMNHIYGENMTLKLYIWAERHALGTRTKLQLEVLISTISAIQEFRKYFRDLAKR